MQEENQNLPTQTDQPIDTDPNAVVDTNAQVVNNVVNTEQPVVTTPDTTPDTTSSATPTEPMVQEMASTPTLEKQVETSELPARDGNGRLLPGNTANPNGRPRGLSITQLVKDALEEIANVNDEKGNPITNYTWKELLIKKILLKAVAEGDKDMIKAIWNYMDGMPLQNIKAEVSQGEISPDKMKEIDELFNKNEITETATNN